jgi:LmbE family N-acetylglucosaminyl deacetylase
MSNVAVFAEQIVPATGAGPVDLLSLNVPDGAEVLVLAPHSDDFDAVSVTMRWLLQRGCSVSLIVLCLDNGVDPDYEPQTPQREIRKREQLAALKFFQQSTGTDISEVEFSNLECDDSGQIFYTPGNLEFVVDLLNTKRPDIVFLPHGNDTNTAHQSVAKLLTEARTHCSHKTLVMFNHDPKTQNMTPNAFIPFGRDLAEWKGELLRFHDSQHQRNLQTRNAGFDDRILDDNRNSAQAAGTDSPYAEIFECIW